MLRPLLRHRRDLGRSQSARFHRDSATRGYFGAQPSAVLACAAWGHGQLERRTDALADRECAFAVQRSRHAGTGGTGVERGTVPRTGFITWPLEPRA